MFIPTDGKRALVIGGGSVALRRVRTLLEFGFAIHVIAEQPCPELERLAAEEDALTLERRSFSVCDCTKGESPVFVVAATNNRTVNHAVAVECAVYDIPVSVADCKEESSFYFPAVAIRGTMVAGISSSGLDHDAVRDAASKIREVLQSANTNREP
jgi:siroheme synthase-like protein